MQGLGCVSTGKMSLSLRLVCFVPGLVLGFVLGFVLGLVLGFVLGCGLDSVVGCGLDRDSRHCNSEGHHRPNAFRMGRKRKDESAGPDIQRDRVV